jgi:hypothetical protein
MLRVDSSFWWVVPFTKLKWPSLSLLINFSLKLTLSDMNIATPAYLWGPFAFKTFFHLLTLSKCLFFSGRWVSYKQHMIGSWFWSNLLFYVSWLGHWGHVYSVLVLRGACQTPVPQGKKKKKERCLFPVIFVSLLFSFTYSLFSGLLAQKGLFLFESSCLTLVSLFKSPLNIFCSAVLVITNFFSFFPAVEGFSFSFN